MDKPAPPDISAMPYLSASLGKRTDRFTAALARLNGYLAEGSIPNPRYEDIRGTLMDGLADAWKAGVPDAMNHLARNGANPKAAWTEGTEESLAWKLGMELDLSSYDGLGAVDRLARKVETHLGRTYPPAIAAALFEARPRLAEIKSVADAMGWLRERRVKRNAPGTAPPEPVLPQATMLAQKAVRTRMREVLGELRGKFTESVVERVGFQADRMEVECRKMVGLLADHAAEVASNRAAGRRVRHTETRDMRTLGIRIANLRQIAKYLIDYDPNTYETRRHADGGARALEFAKSETERVFHLWTERNVDKLAPIVEAKEGVDIRVIRASASYDGVDTVMAVRFPDTSRFTFSNAIEYSVSPLGLPFARFPARYHDVVDADGTKLKAPSEARVKEAFIPSEEPEDGPRP